MTEKQLNDALRIRYLNKFVEFLKANEEDVLITGSNEICFPVLDEEKNDKFIQLVVKVPKGSRDGEGFDGYTLAEDYKMKLEQKKVDAEKKAIAKAKKIEKDKKVRAEKKEKGE